MTGKQYSLGLMSSLGVKIIYVIGKKVFFLKTDCFIYSS